MDESNKFVIFFDRSIDKNKRFDDKNEENICEDMLLHTFVSSDTSLSESVFNVDTCQFTDDEKVHGKKKKIKNSRIVFEVVLRESNTKWEQDLPPKKKDQSLFNMTKVNIG